MSAPLEKSQSLKDRFQDDWYKFTSEFDDALVDTILDQHAAPDNEPHESFKSSFVAACAKVAEVNGEQFEKAVYHLQSRRS